jgi:hypothetical protein
MYYIGMESNKKAHPDTKDQGHGYWKDGKFHQSASTKQANRAGRSDRNSFYHRYTGREEVCDE